VSPNKFGGNKGRLNKSQEVVNSSVIQFGKICFTD
jgi:hypothetical protein